MYNVGMKDKELERRLKALANRRRLAILRYIKNKREGAVGEIAEYIKLSFRSTSKHLSVLFATDMLEKEQRSSRVFYSLASGFPEPIRRIVAFL